MRPAQMTVVALLLLVPCGAQSAVTFTGRVVDEKGRPIAGAGLAGGERNRLLTRTVLERPHARCDKDGGFCLEVAGRDKEGLLIAANGRAAFTLRYHPALYAPVPGPVDLGTIVLPKGTTILGQVRGPDGKPLAGVRVTSRDLLRSGNVVRHEGDYLVHRSQALTDGKGIFKLPCVCSSGLELTFAAKGYYLRRLRPVGKHSPLSVTLHPSGLIEGRLVDADGNGIETVLQIDYEAGFRSMPVPTAPDGAFQATVAHQGRYRLKTMPKPGSRVPAVSSAVMAGPQKGIVLRADAKSTSTQECIVRAVDAGSGRSVGAFEVTVFWGFGGHEAAGQLALSAQGRPRVQSDAKGRAILPAPPAGQESGALLVTAAGHADTVVGVDTTSADSRKITVRMGVESAIKGKVVDATTGKPLAGAKVWPVWLGPRGRLGVYYGGPPYRPARTDASGGFRLGGLSAGVHGVQALVKNRPVPEAVRCTVIEGLATTGVVIRVDRGATLTGKLTGDEIGPGWQVAVDRPRVTSGSISGAAVYSGGWLPLQSVSLDGTFVIGSLAAGAHSLRLLRPADARSGRRLQTPLGDVTLTGNEQRTFDLGKLRPARVTGKVRVAGNQPILQRLVVLATVNVDRRPRGRSLINQVMRVQEDIGIGVVGPLGDFHLQVPAGSYNLRVYDISTGIELSKKAKPVELAAGSSLAQDLVVKVLRVRLQLVPKRKDQGQVGHQIRIERIGELSRRRAAREYRFLIGLRLGQDCPLDAMQKVVDFWAPPGKYKVSIWNRAEFLTDAGTYRNSLLASEEFEVRSDEADFAIPVGAPRR